MTLSQVVLQYVVPTLAPILMGALIGLSIKLGLYFHARQAESKLARVGAFFADLVHSIVAEVDVTLKPKLLEASADGVITPEEANQLKTLALELVKGKLPAWAANGAAGIFGGQLDTYLKGLIERAVTARKAEVAIAENPRLP